MQTETMQNLAVDLKALMKDYKIAKSLEKQIQKTLNKNLNAGLNKLQPHR